MHKGSARMNGIHFEVMVDNKFVQWFQVWDDPESARFLFWSDKNIIQSQLPCIHSERKLRGGLLNLIRHPGELQFIALCKIQNMCITS